MQKCGFVQAKCAKCGGSVYLDRDQFGWYEQCLQCGFISDLENTVGVTEKKRRDSAAHS
jgi:hypothetical protein